MSLRESFFELRQKKEREVAEVKHEREQCKRELVDVKDRCRWLEGRLNLMEQRVKELEVVNQRQKTIVEEVQKKEREEEERRKIRDRIEFEKKVRAEIVAKKKKH